MLGKELPKVTREEGVERRCKAFLSRSTSSGKSLRGGVDEVDDRDVWTVKQINGVEVEGAGRDPPIAVDAATDSEQRMESGSCLVADLQAEAAGGSEDGWTKSTTGTSTSRMPREEVCSKKIKNKRELNAPCGRVALCTARLASGRVSDDHCAPWMVELEDDGGDVFRIVRARVGGDILMNVQHKRHVRDWLASSLIKWSKKGQAEQQRNHRQRAA